MVKGRKMFVASAGIRAQDRLHRGLVTSTICLVQNRLQ